MTQYQDVPEFCYAATLDEIGSERFFISAQQSTSHLWNRDENIDFEDKNDRFTNRVFELLKAEAQSKEDLLTVLKN